MNLEEQNQEILKRWEKIYPESYKDDIEPPLLNEELDDKKFKLYIDAIKDMIQDNGNLIDARNNYKRQYIKIRNKVNHEPTQYNKFIYLFWLLFLVILEVPTNYTTIEQFLHKPVISAMITIAIGSLLVFIAHSHGAFFKQLTDINNKSERDKRTGVKPKITRYIYAIAGFVAIVIIMYGLYYARLQYFIQISGVSADDPFGDGSGVDLMNATIMIKVGILMLANFSIYILGIIASYKVHDEKQGYQEAHLALKKYNDKLKKECRELQKYLNDISNNQLTGAR